MGHLMRTTAPVTMTSREIAELTGKRHDHVMRDVETMLADLGETSPHFWGDLPDSYGRRQRVALLPKRESLILVSGYSVAMRAKIIDRWQALEVVHAAPAALSRMDILRLAMECEQARIVAEGERDHAIATKAQIGSRREATAMAKASAAVREANRLKGELGRNQQHATIIAVEKASGQLFHWPPLRKWCAENGLQPATAPDPRYGEVKAWPAQAWEAVYGLRLRDLFPGQEAA